MQWIQALLPLILMVGIFYLIIFLPENRRKKQYNKMIDELKVKDEVVTKGGVVGKISHIDDEYITLETGANKTKIKFVKNGIAYKVEPKTVDKTAKTSEKKK